MLQVGHYLHALFSKAKNSLNLGSTILQMIGALKSVLMDGPLMKLAFDGLKNYSFHRLIHGQKVNIDF
ncbi:hypothetical protein PDIP_48750 [Penicillium digitatum Pd1]|uniref:Uncharacterized protein n=1 Tax=Penicillium digitatum (strain Pd1 / CECT 20795) TaxID=1170230 RepID=K9FY10_PEND1|nr:hypothetical protein PDIP_48750 [Penicillium digitatum Pd1]EKV13382.1 hypothetical protein PDIP_48750 [Penicillium digitatum Pd1]